MNSSNSLYGRTERAIGKLAFWLTLLSGVFLLIAIVITTLSILGREGAGLWAWAALYFGLDPSLLGLNKLSAIPGDYEMVEVFIGLAVFGFLPYCQLARGHVGVDLFVIPFGNRAMTLTQTLGDIVIAGLTLLLTSRHIIGSFDKYDSGETTFILAFPVWWGFAAAAVIMVLLSIVTLFTVVRDIRDLIMGNTVELSAGGH